MDDPLGGLDFATTACVRYVELRDNAADVPQILLRRSSLRGGIPEAPTCRGICRTSAGIRKERS
ncbi:MAG: hypothetical protein MUQ10_16840, partial [Anaerolineae bacterium]|nr:hypothetical protein [Anaerolineae bacterium]